MSEPTSARASPVKEVSPSAAEPMIDPELADLPAPPHHSNGSGSSASASANPTASHLRDTPYPLRAPGESMGITEAIGSAPNPHTTDFSPLPFTTDSSIDVAALDAAAVDEPGSPNARLLRAIAPPNAAQPNPNWPAPPPNASVNLFIGRALLSNGNDNWPLKPNDIVNWIRKHYPEEWDGDEGRCSAHRVRTYLARKGADMYYEKLNQGCIAGWRIRQNHLWRFENGGFQGRGMKQEEAMAQQQKENDAMATAVHKAAAAAALAQGHPGIKVSMSSLDGGPPHKRARKPNGQARRRNEIKKKSDDDYPYEAYAQSYLPQPVASGSAAASTPTSAAGPSGQGLGLDPGLVRAHDDGSASASGPPSAAPDSEHLDAAMVQQAMAAAAATSAANNQMDELEMGIQLPIEMQMHSGTHDDDANDENYNRQYYGEYGYAAGQGYGSGYQQNQ